MSLQKYIPWFTGLFVFILYLFTIAPSVIQIDSGELAAVQITAGIAHPTGYPLFTLAGYIWSLIPLPVSGILQMNILAALLTSLAVVFFVKTSIFILINDDSFKVLKKLKEKKKKRKDKPQRDKVSLPGLYIYISSVAAALILAFSKTFWFQSTSVEVYSLHLFLIMLIIFLLMKAYAAGTNSITDKHWIIFSITLALGFSNHMTTLLIIPGTIYLYFNKYRFSKESFLRLSLMIGLFLVVLIAFYLYLPIRASGNPSINWGNPVDLERIMRHISGKQYQVWLFSSTDSAKKQLEYFITNLPGEFGFSLLAVIAGIILSFKYLKKFSVFLIICFLSTVLYSINYDISDIDAYFLLAYISLAFFSVFIFFRLSRYFYPSGKGFKTIAAATGILILLQIYMNYRNVDQSNNYAFEDYTKTILNGVSKDAIIFGYQWDFLISPAYYFQFAEGLRKDVAVIDKELLRRSWYYNQMETNYPEVVKGVSKEIKLFNQALLPFERDENFDANLLENLYRRLMTRLVSTNIVNRDFYLTPEIVEGEMQKGEFTLPEGYTIIPDNLLFKVVKGKEYVPAADPGFKIRIPEIKNRYINSIELFAGSMLARRALYELQFDRKERARLYIDKLKKEFPGYRIPGELNSIF